MSIPIDFKEQIDSLKQPYIGNLDTFKEYYVLTKQFPNDETYTRFYENSRNNLQKGMSELFVISNAIQKEIENIKNKTTNLDTNIKNEQERNKELNNKLKGREGDVNGAQTLIDDYNKMYVIQYVSNVTMLVGCVIVGRLMYKTFGS
jgi:hypothetical protein